VGRTLKCVYNISSVVRAHGRGHRVSDATLSRSGASCTPPPCCAAASWPNRPGPSPLCLVPLPRAVAAALLTWPPTRPHPVASKCVSPCPTCPASAIGGHCSGLTAPVHARHAKLLLSPLLIHSLGLPLKLARLPRGLASVLLPPIAICLDELSHHVTRDPLPPSCTARVTSRIYRGLDWGWPSHVKASPACPRQHWSHTSFAIARGP
jgi:hypothetical protein